MITLEKKYSFDIEAYTGEPTKSDAELSYARGSSKEAEKLVKKETYKDIAVKCNGLLPGESMSYTREIRGADFRVDFYPKGLIARRDIPQKANFSRDYLGRYSYLWKPDYTEYCNNDNIPGKKVLEEIVQLDLSLSPKEHELRFFYNCPESKDDRMQAYRSNALNQYTRSDACLMLIRNMQSGELLGLVGVSRNQRDKNVYELGMEIAGKARNEGLAEAAIEDLAGILKASGTARTIEGNYLFIHGRRNSACDGLFNKKRREVAQGISRFRNVELSSDPHDPECKKFIITL